MGLNSFVCKEPRSLPVFILADISGSMMGEKINELNLALREMVTEFKNADEIRGKFQLCIVTFGSTAQVHLPLSDVDNVQINELSAGGRTSMGEAFDIVRTLIEDRNVVSSKAYTPTIVLVSDGVPTDCDPAYYNNGHYDEWDKLIELQQGERSQKCQRLALGIGEDADVRMLKAFIGNSETPVIRSKDVNGISKFFRWVTMSTIARMSSINPNLIQPSDLVFDLADEDIII